MYVHVRPGLFIPGLGQNQDQASSWRVVLEQVQLVVLHSLAAQDMVLCNQAEDL